MADTLFTKIINGQIPSYKIHEDELTFTFLDINQHHQGSLLIVPKAQVDHFFDLEDSDYNAIFQTAKVLSPILKKAFGSERVGLVIEGLEVPHAHIKLYPINGPGDIGDNKIAMLSEEEMTRIQNKILELL